MASTKPYNQPRYERASNVKHERIGANTLLPDGTLVMNQSGSAVPFTDTGFQGGAKLLGFANETYENTTGAAVDRTSKMMFIRGQPWECEGKAGDLPLASDVGGLIAASDNLTCKKTIATNDLQVVLLELRPGGKYLVELP
jgi:hypothetical protein